MTKTTTNIAVWDEKLFLSTEGKKAWSELLAHSSADPLFLSWSWMSVWWQHWGGRPNDELIILAAYQNGQLVGLAPLYKNVTRILKRTFSVRRVEFLGTRYQGSSGFRTEYLQFIARDGFENEVTPLLFEYLFSRIKFDEVLLSDTNTANLNLDQHCPTKLLSNSIQRQLSSEDAYAINTSGSFSEYLSSLGKNTRLKLYNRRKLLSQYGDVKCVALDLDTNINSAFEVLIPFHLSRYDNDGFKPTHINMLNSFVSTMGYRQADSSILFLDERPLSVIINLRAQGRIYNLQLGFEQNFDKRISIGTLHIGYALEQAFNDPEITAFDFLAGHGKSENYKVRLSNQTCSLATTHIVINPILKLLYQFNDHLIRPLKRLF